MVERLSMAGEGNLSPEGSTAVLTPSQEGNGVIPVGTESLSAEDAIKEAELLLSKPQQIGTSIIPENVNDPNQIPTEQQTGGAQELQDQQNGEAVQSGEGGGGQPPDNGGGGEGGRNGEGPPGPRNPDYIWSPEFRIGGRSIAGEIIRLEALAYSEKYDNINGPKLDQLYKDWKAWVSQARKASFTRRPFDEKDANEESDRLLQAEREIVRREEEAERFLAERNDLVDTLPPIKDEIDPTTKEITTKGLGTIYNELREDPNTTPEQIVEVEHQLSVYFKEAKRLGLLKGADSSLGAIYSEMMRGVATDTDHAEIWDRVHEKQKKISVMSQAVFLAKRRANREIVQQINKLDGIWDVYTNLAVERFSLLLEEPGLVAPFAIDGEFTFNVNDFTFSTQSQEGLRQFLQNDEELREISQARREEIEEELMRLSGGNLDEVERLNNDRQELLRRLTQEREARFRSNIAERQEAIKNLAGDREAYRRLATSREVYWSPTYANYYTVRARTPEQFQVAVDTFTQWIRSGLTKSPNELFQRVSGFKDALTTAGVREAANVDQGFINGLRQELEGMIGILGANHANESYNPDYLKQFLDFAAADEGPARFVRLGRASRGKVSAILHKIDNDPRYELFFSTHASRGQLFEERNPIEIHRLRTQIKDLLIEEMLGVDIKEYDPRDLQKREVDKYLEQNLNDLARFQSDEEFLDLFEGFDLGDQKIYEQGQLQRKLARFNRAKEIDQQIHGSLNSLNLTPEEKADYQLYKKGKLLTKYEDRLIKAIRIRELLDAGKDPDDLKELKGEDQGLYELYQETKNAVDLALELYGVTGEKSKRSGGILLVDKRDERDNKIADYLPISWAEKFVHFAENWTKATYGLSTDESGDQLDPKVQAKLQKEKRRVVKGLSAAEMKNRVAQARRMSIWALKAYGFGAKLYDFTLLRDGEPVDPNTLGYDEDGVDESRDNDVDKYRYAVPENPRILGYNTKGDEVILAFDNNGKPVTLEYDEKHRPTGRLVPLEYGEDGKAVIYDKKIGEENRQLIKFDNLDVNTKADPMMLKVPRLSRIDGKVNRPEVFGYTNGVVISRSYGKPITEQVDLVEVDFQRATHHVYSRWTGHPYWGYQEEDTGLILTTEAFEAAKRIRNGQSRPEDEEPHATQLLIVDPTLQRVGHFKNKESREDKIILAAVEESYQGHWRIRDELQQAFLPDGPDVESARTAYVLQDDGGSIKEWEHMSFEASRWPLMKLRRARSIAALLPLHFAPMSEVWGAGGVLNTLRMFGYSEYKMVGLFALQKWIAQTKGAQDVYESITGWVSEQEKRSREGYGEKPNNDADSLQRWFNRINTILVNIKDKTIVHPTSEHVDNEFVNAVRESMGRPEVTQQRIRVFETDMRGERAPLWLEGIDIYERDPDGGIKIEKGERAYNGKLDSNRDSGSSRHSGTIWFWRMVKWQKSEGENLYPTEAMYYSLMDQPTIASMRMARIIDKGQPTNYFEKKKLVSRWRWLLGKIVR